MTRPELRAALEQALEYCEATRESLRRALIADKREAADEAPRWVIHPTGGDLHIRADEIGRTWTAEDDVRRVETPDGTVYVLGPFPRAADADARAGRGDR